MVQRGKKRRVYRFSTPCLPHLRLLTTKQTGCYQAKTELNLPFRRVHIPSRHLTKMCAQCALARTFTRAQVNTSRMCTCAQPKRACSSMAVMAVFTGMPLGLPAALHTLCGAPCSCTCGALRSGCHTDALRSPRAGLHRLPSTICIMVMCPLFGLGCLLLILVPI